MQSDWAAQNLQTIRTLMERSAVYRRALGPLLAIIGITGLGAAILGNFIQFATVRSFIEFWIAVAIIGAAEAFLMIRRQALVESEPFWSPPTRRIVQGLLPPFFSAVAIAFALATADDAKPFLPLLVPVWMALYGCGMHAAGSFMPRGFKLFGWIFVVCGCALGIVAIVLKTPLPEANTLMGIFFGGGHLAYGTYLYFTEKKKGAA